ncbi:hypothetical protein [Brachybacterium sp.]|uniref:hypothetical protein n=1 Tax=Brachybacterium sp. TaxID=1891286 RepID=UPI002ED1AFB8
MTSPKNLRDLVRDHIDRTGDSYAQIAQKTGLSKPLIGAIMTVQDHRSYRSETVEKIARGLRLPVDMVSRAAAVSAGMEVDARHEASDREDARVITEALEVLTDEELATLRVMVQALADRNGR